MSAAFFGPKLSFADVSWLRLMRHDTECADCPRGQPGAGPQTIDYCDERKKLFAEHAVNATAEKERQRA